MIRTLAILIVIGIAAKVWGPFHIDYNVLEVAVVIAGAAAITYFKAWRETETYRARMVNYLEARDLMADFASWSRGPSHSSPYLSPTPLPSPAIDGQESRPSADELKVQKAGPLNKWADLVEDATHDAPRAKSTLQLYEPTRPKGKP